MTFLERRLSQIILVITSQTLLSCVCLECLSPADQEGKAAPVVGKLILGGSKQVHAYLAAFLKFPLSQCIYMYLPPQVVSHEKCTLTVVAFECLSLSQQKCCFLGQGRLKSPASPRSLFSLQIVFIWILLRASLKDNGWQVNATWEDWKAQVDTSKGGKLSHPSFTISLWEIFQ